MYTQDWLPKEILAAVRSKNITLRQLAMKNGLPEKACQQALHRPYEQPERLIASTLGVHPMVLWPSRYHADGERKKCLHSKMVAKKIPADTFVCMQPKAKETHSCLPKDAE